MNDWLISKGIYLPIKGETAWEWQIGNLWGRVVHLRNNYWSSWFMLERVSIYWTDKTGKHHKL
jgi:hypothetical protein